MSNYVLSIKVNNLQRELNTLENTVANLQIGGETVISGNLQMNDYSIQEINTLQFNTGEVLETSSGNLVFNEDTVVTSSNIGTYQQYAASDNFDLQGNYLLNAGKITFEGSINPLMVVSDNILWNNNPIVTSANISNYESYTANQDYDLDGNSLTNTNSIIFTDSTILKSNEATEVTYTLGQGTTQTGNSFSLPLNGYEGFTSNQALTNPTITTTLTLGANYGQTSVQLGITQDPTGSGGPVYGVSFYPVLQTIEQVLNSQTNLQSAYSQLQVNLKLVASGTTLKIFINDVEQESFQMTIPAGPFYVTSNGFFQI